MGVDQDILEIIGYRFSTERFIVPITDCMQCIYH